MESDKDIFSENVESMMLEGDDFYLWLASGAEKKGVTVMDDYYFTLFKGTIND